MALEAKRLKYAGLAAVGLAVALSFAVSRKSETAGGSESGRNLAAAPAAGSVLASGAESRSDGQKQAAISQPAPVVAAQGTPVPDLMSKLPEQFRQNLLEAQRRHDRAYASEAGARGELKSLKDCVSGSNGPAAVKFPEEVMAKMTPEMKSQIANMGLTMQAQCVFEAQKLAAKFPALQPEVRREIIAKAPPRAVQMARRPK